MEEVQLVKRMKAGDRSAFDSIYEQYHIPIFRAAYLLCGNRQDAEDVLQETFLLCWLHSRELRKEESFRYWLFRIMTKEAARAAKKRSMLYPDENIQETVDRKRSSEDAGGPDEYEKLLERNIVEAAMEKLPAQQREVVVLYYYSSMSVKEIAATLQVFEGTVKSRLFMARNNLRSAMEQHEKESRNG